MASPTVSSLATATITNFLEVRSPYDYIPGLAPGLAFTVVFGILTIAHIVVALKFRYWVALIALVPGGLLEVLGWAGRLWSHYTVLNSNPFIMQICCLILGPAFFSAWAYTVLGYCIVSLGPGFSLLKAKAYLAIFVTADAVCLILQAVGGGMAAVAAKKGTGTKGPTNIMLAGVLVQLGTMTAFSILAIDFITRVIVRKPYAFRVRSLERQGLWSGIEPSSSGTATPPTPSADADADIEKTIQPVHVGGVSEMDRARRLRKGKLLLVGTAFASAMIYARGVYRSIELAQGWTGNLMTHEVYFVWLDGFPMVLCLAMFLALHPGWLIEHK